MSKRKIADEINNAREFYSIFFIISKSEKFRNKNVASTGISNYKSKIKSILPIFLLLDRFKAPIK